VVEPVISSNNISPPSALDNFTYFAVEAEVENSQPVPEAAPATGVPLPSFVTLTIVIEPPVDSVNITFVPDTVAVIFDTPAALTSLQCRQQYQLQYRM
jgi:hypothetical protein